MHRHGYKGKKFGRQRDPRQALMSGLAESLVLNGSLETTFAKAKSVQGYTEKLITKAKQGHLHARRQLIAELNTLAAVNKLVDELAPKLKSRNSGYLRVERTGLRRGDGSQMAKVSFVDDLSSEVLKPVKQPKDKAALKSDAPKKPVKTTVKTAKAK